MRNSALVELVCAEDVTGLSIQPKFRHRKRGRVASYTGRSVTVRKRGLYTRENVGMSSERQVRILPAENLRIPEEGSSAQGKSGPKPRTKVVGDGQQVEIPVPPRII